ncbi:tripartite tricarboxylate transporter substrate binding protein [Hylemonella gracilis]|jgi:tripartite-type tricarboxylate transporter receptor subunit TctC|uniref:Tripartite tricarboxylate transporter substrate binding protein n=1 Tax=Hylemonella gracilis TaxID=80880 RepID=A0A4P6UHC0_9BURK|nr:tripartite tricarboxylate transporter substrate binding protein [Hylemonella gracilis]QBK04688.1 tripartite tricarboxylate transporter substrate binding protein [Hylemonella gracilis]
MSHSFRLSRRVFAAWAGLGTLATAAGVRAQAGFPQPGRPIRLLVGLAAGGSLDGQARAIGQRLAEIAGTQVVVDNKPGASMMISAQELMRAAPDGHTLLYAPSSVFAQNPHTLSKVPYDPFKDFTPISMAAKGPLVLTTHVSLPVQNLPELVAWGKANPGKLNFANFGTGTSSHVYAAAFARAAGIDVVHVPYKGTADAARDLLEGRVQAYFDAAPTAIQNRATGRIRILGVVASARSPALPEVPTITEGGVSGMDLPSWIAIVGPAGMAPETVSRLNGLIRQALSSQSVRDFMAKGAYEPVASTPAELMQEMHIAYERWGTMIQQIGFEKQ